VGVEWHPENFWATGEFAPLFEAFVRACALLNPTR
jgi:gamma-glutamyl-gamma-aminobutyrate hydrolase PuuD